MRSILENVRAYDLRAKVGFSFDVLTQTIAATFNMAADGPVVHEFDCGSSGRTVVLPSITNGTDINGRVHIIRNVGAANNITLNAHADDSSTNVATIAPGQQVIVVASLAKLKWYTGDLAGGAAGLTLNDGTNIALGTTTGTDIGTSTSQKLGFYGTTPVVQPTTASEAAVSTAAITSVVTTAATATSPVGYTTTTQANAIVTAINSLITQVASLTTLCNQLRADLVTLGLIKGS